MPNPLIRKPPAERRAERQERRALLRLTWPILLTQTAQAAYGLVDTLMAGRLGAADLAAVAIGAALWLPAFLLLSGILAATTPLVASALGAGQRLHVPHLTWQSLWAALGLGLLGWAGLSAGVWLLPLFAVPELLQPKACLYLLGVAMGMPAVALYSVLRSYCEALGHPRPVTVLSVAGLLLNIPLNAWLMYGGWGVPALGGAGCGFATALTLWVMTGILALYVSWARFCADIRLFAQVIWPDWAAIGRLLRLGVPIGVAIFFETSLFSVAALVLSPLGQTTVAAHQIALSVTSQLFMIPLSLGMALTIRMGHYHGAQDGLAARRLRRVGLQLATLLACASMLLIAVARHPLAALYSNDPAVQQLAAQLLLFALAYQVVDAWQVTSAGMLRGLHDTQVPMWLTLFCYWLVALPLGVYAARVAPYGAQGFWLGLVLGLGLAALLLLWRLAWRLHPTRLRPHAPLADDPTLP